tara:strand:+ start:731 stop:1297 length:567 start_codon:yes stop_codon:yes gene_type:complete
MNDDLINFTQEVKNFKPKGTQKVRLENVISGLNKFLDECNTVVFLCTHNSRRSQYCEIWSKYFSSTHKNKINFFSAGVVKTKVHKQIYKSLERVGIGVNKNLSINTETISISPFSKTLSEIEEKKFISIMTCSNSEKTCPVDTRSLINLKLFYEDPKVYDNTTQEDEEYDKTSFMIACEINYILKNIN